MEKKELKRMAIVLQELGLSYAETIDVIQEMSKDVNNIKKLWRGDKKSRLIKLAFTLITFPEPTPISETIGAAVLVAGLVQNRIKKSTLQVEDINQDSDLYRLRIERNTKAAATALSWMREYPQQVVIVPQLW